MYTSYFFFFPHKIHVIKFYQYVIYYWSLESRIIAEGSLSSVATPDMQQHQGHWHSHSPLARCSLMAEGAKLTALRLHLHGLKTRICVPAVGGDHCIGVGLGMGVLSGVSSTIETASAVEIQQTVRGHNCAAHAAWRTQQYSSWRGRNWEVHCQFGQHKYSRIKLKNNQGPQVLWYSHRQNKTTYILTVFCRKRRDCCYRCILDSASRELL